MNRLIVCAAIRNSSGTIICGPRHLDLTMHAQIALCTQGGWKFAEQGFVDQHGEFLTRAAAWEIAYAAQQIRRTVGNGGRELYSENLY